MKKHYKTTDTLNRGLKAGEQQSLSDAASDLSTRLNDGLPVHLDMMNNLGLKKLVKKLHGKLERQFMFKDGLDDLCDLLIDSGLIAEEAYTDPIGYDKGITMERIEDLYGKLVK